MLRRAKNFFKTPKGLLTLVLAALIAIAAPAGERRQIAVGLAGAALAAGAVDLLILRVRKNVWEFPSGAVLSAMIVTMVLREQEPWRVLAITSIIAVVSKYVIRSRTANVFNPAALAMIASFYLFHTGQNWWGALAEVAPAAKLALLAGGLFITDRVNKMPLALVFLGAYFALFTVTAYAGNPLDSAEIFRTPDAEAALYFAFFILTDPPTSPAKYRDQIFCGLIAAAASYLVFELAGVVYYLLAGAMAGNIWEAWRRVNRRSGQTFPRGAAAFLREIGPWRAVRVQD